MTPDQKRVFLAVQFGGVKTLCDETGKHQNKGWVDMLAGEDVTPIVDKMLELGLLSFNEFGLEANLRAWSQ